LIVVIVWSSLSKVGDNSGVFWQVLAWSESGVSLSSKDSLQLLLFKVCTAGEVNNLKALRSTEDLWNYCKGEASDLKSSYKLVLLESKVQCRRLLWGWSTSENY
jgi:hypothetical protein